MLLAVAAGCGACILAGAGPHLRQILTAAGVCTVAGEVALVPLLLTRGCDVAAVSQAGLAATIVHMLLTVVLAVVAVEVIITGDRNGFFYALFALYWISLMFVAGVAIRMIRNATPAAKTPA